MMAMSEGNGSTFVLYCVVNPKDSKQTMKAMFADSSST